jgi:hypothetical protein
MAAAGVGAWWLLAPGSTSLAHDGARTTAPSTVSAASAKAEQGGGAPGGAATRAPYSTAGQLVHAEKQKLWQARYEQAEQVYASYRDATRYPHESRPLIEHPDQIHPFDPVSEETSLRNANGEPIKGVRLRTTQDRVFLSASDTVRFSIEALDDQGQRLPVLVRSAAAQSVPDTRTPVPLIQTDVAFGDNGTGADLQAGDGTYTALLNPALQGFGNYDGTIRVLAQVAAKGQQGVAHFDVVYAPGVPASWAGVREAVEGGSLNFYVKAQVRVAGHYVVSGRVDDSQGKPFALVQFNQQVAAGTQEMRLQVFGALIRDKAPAFPLRLRDVEGFILYPDRFPDRALMPRWAGVVHQSASYPLSRFSTDEWSSEERERYLAEYARDADEARQELEALMSR